MKTREQMNAHKRQNYLRPDVQERQAAANKRWYEKKIASDGECKPYLGLSFNSTEVQSTLTMWGG